MQGGTQTAGLFTPQPHSVYFLNQPFKMCEAFGKRGVVNVHVFPPGSANISSVFWPLCTCTSSYQINYTSALAWVCWSIVWKLACVLQHLTLAKKTSAERKYQKPQFDPRVSNAIPSGAILVEPPDLIRNIIWKKIMKLAKGTTRGAARFRERGKHANWMRRQEKAVRTYILSAWHSTSSWQTFE